MRRRRRTQAASRAVARAFEVSSSVLHTQNVNRGGCEASPWPRALRPCLLLRRKPADNSSRTRKGEIG
eukprot:7383283-Prymnesium_polylepis.2